jgi:hypothetical protein
MVVGETKDHVYGGGRMRIVKKNTNASFVCPGKTPLILDPALTVPLYLYRCFWERCWGHPGAILGQSWGHPRASLGAPTLRAMLGPRGLSSQQFVPIGDDIHVRGAP